MSHYSYKSIPDAKFETDSPFIFWRYHVTKFPSEEGNESSNSAMSRIVLFDPKLTPHVNFINFQAEENLFIFKIFGTSR